MIGFRHILAILTAFTLALTPLAGAFGAMQAAMPDEPCAAAQAGGADSGCCDEEQGNRVCMAHCAAGSSILTPVVQQHPFPLEISTFVLPVLVRITASQAPAPDPAPPKTSAS